jgi:hypothetical protein
MLAEERLRLRVTPRGRDDVRARGAPAAGVLAHGAAADRDAAHRRPPQRRPAHGAAADGEEDAEGEPAQADEPEREAAEGEPAHGEPTDRDPPDGSVPDRDHAPRVATHLPLLQVGAERDRDQRDVADRGCAAVAHPRRAASPQAGHLLLQLAHALLEVGRAGHGAS